jgi:hypothetical protein
MLAGDIDYSNFKRAVATRQGRNQVTILGDVWLTLYRLQD